MKSFKIILSLLLSAMLLVGCSGGETAKNSIELNTFYDDYQVYTKYLTPTEFNDSDFSFDWVANDDGTYTAALFNDSTDLYASGTLNIYEASDSKDALSSSEMYLIRPNDYDYVDLEEAQIGDYFDVTDVKAYEFTFASPIDYEFKNDNDGTNGFNDIIIDGTYTMDDVKTIAQREYIINVLTGYKYPCIYLFDGTHTQDPDYPDYPALDSAVYVATFDYSKKTIEVIEGNDQYADAAETITME